MSKLFYVQKISALHGGAKIINRVTEMVTEKEMEDFISGLRPEFKKDKVLAVRFETNYTAATEPESTQWYVNPCLLPAQSVEATISDEFGPKLDYIYLPELLFLQGGDAFFLYDEFNLTEDVEDISDEEKWERFMAFLQNHE